MSNLFSFKDETEFNMLPGKRISRLSHHKHNIDGVEVLKLAAVYGANGAGKSNFIRAIEALQSFVVNGDLPLILVNEKFKLSEKSRTLPVYMGIEFTSGKEIFLYEVEVSSLEVSKETLSLSGQGKNEDTLLFSRTIEEEKIKMKFSKEFYHNKENSLFSNMLETTFIKPNKSAFNLLNSLGYPGLEKIGLAFKWIKSNLIIITPKTKLVSLPHIFDLDETINKFANNLICSFSTGVASIHVDIKPLSEFIGADNPKMLDNLTAQILSSPNTVRLLNSDVIAVNHDGKVVTKQLFLQHKNDQDQLINFTLSEESDGTKRLLEYVPAIQQIIENEVTYLIDEMERSVHALTIKEIIAKFSEDEQTKGQLIFTTHESNLLDQDVFRQDEIWFVQKNSIGASEMYPLSDFKEHHTIDIQKGYLNGRYGAIPFLGNLHDLNWNKYAAEQ